MSNEDLKATTVTTAIGISQRLLGVGGTSTSNSVNLHVAYRPGLTHIHAACGCYNLCDHAVLRLPVRSEVAEHP